MLIAQFYIDSQPQKSKYFAGAAFVNHPQIKHWTVILTITTAALITACGGSSDSPAPSPLTLSAPQELLPRVEAQRSTAGTTQATYADPELSAAFDRLNAMRLRAGVGALTQNPYVDKAAQLHSEYQGLNALITHDQVAGRPGFSGTTVFKRIPAAGYADFRDATEVIAPIHLPVPRRPSPTQAVDLLLGTPLHRSAILRPQYVDAGIGLAGDKFNKYLTIDMAYTFDNIQGAPENDIVQDHLILWPPSGMTDMPTSMFCEDPNPIPENGVGVSCLATTPAGYPASVQVNHTALRSISKIVQFEMREKATGNLIDTKLLADSWHAADPALALQMGRPEYRVPDSYYDGNSFVAILPKVPLKRNTEYEVTFVGIVFEARYFSNQPSVTTPYHYPQVRKIWYFTTGDKLDY
jgi:uncharacterized protein YkwD